MQRLCTFASLQTLERRDQYCLLCGHLGLCLSSLSLCLISAGLKSITTGTLLFSAFAPTICPPLFFRILQKDTSGFVFVYSSLTTLPNQSFLCLVGVQTCCYCICCLAGVQNSIRQLLALLLHQWLRPPSWLQPTNRDFLCAPSFSFFPAIYHKRLFLPLCFEMFLSKFS